MEDCFGDKDFEEMKQSATLSGRYFFFFERLLKLELKSGIFIRSRI